VVSAGLPGRVLRCVESRGANKLLCRDVSQLPARLGRDASSSCSDRSATAAAAAAACRVRRRGENFQHLPRRCRRQENPPPPPTTAPTATAH